MKKGIFTEEALKIRDKLFRQAEKYLRNKWDAEDAVQDLFVKLAELDKKPEKYLHVQNHPGYIVMVARHVLNEIGATNKKRAMAAFQLAMERYDKVMVDQDNIDAIRAIVKIHKILRGRMRQVMELYAIGYTTNEIAKYLVTTPAAAHTYVSRARKILRSRNIGV